MSPLLSVVRTHHTQQTLINCSLIGQCLIWSEFNSFLFPGPKSSDKWVFYPSATEQLYFVEIVVFVYEPKSPLLSSVISITGFPSLFGLLNRIIIISFLAYSLPSLLLHMHYCFLYCFDFSHFQILLQILWGPYETLSCQGSWIDITVLLKKKKDLLILVMVLLQPAGFANYTQKTNTGILRTSFQEGCSQILRKNSDYSVFPVIPNSVGRQQSRLLNASSQTLDWGRRKISQFLCKQRYSLIFSYLVLS